MNATTWVLVAEGARARLFEMQTPTSPLMELEAFTHPDGHLRSGARNSDAPGRYGTRKSARTTGITGGAHIFDSDGPAREAEASFARLLTETLERGRIEGAYEKLVLIAAPSLLGALRDHLSESAKRCLVQELAKNFTRYEPEEIRARVEGALA